MALGTGGGSGNLILCEVLKFHIDRNVLKDGVIEPDLIDLVGRNSANYYTRASHSSIFEIEKPIAKTGIGIDNLPDFIRNSHFLSANKLGNIEKMPQREDILNFIESARNAESLPQQNLDINSSDHFSIFQYALQLAESDKKKAAAMIELAAKKALEQNRTEFAINALLAIEIF